MFVEDICRCVTTPRRPLSIRRDSTRAEMSAKAETLTKDAENASAPVPRDVRLISLILASMGIEDADPAVLVQLLEFAHRMLLLRLTRRIHSASTAGCTRLR